MSENIIFIVNTGRFFFSHRSEVIEIATRNNFLTKVICGPPYVEKDINKYNIVKLSFSRSKILTLHDFISFIRLTLILTISKKSIIHCITIKPIFWIGIINTFLRLDHILLFSFSGFGLLYDKEKFSKFKFFLISKFLKLLFLGKNHPFSIFQNNYDMQNVCNIVSSVKKNSILIKGSGTNIKKFNYVKFPSNPMFLFASRLLKSKGVLEFINLAKLFNEKKDIKYKNLKFVIAGNYDFENRDSISRKELNEINKLNNIEYIGYEKNVEKLIKKCRAVILPSSYGEGVPKIVLDAGACGRPVIIYENYWNEKVVINKKTGLVVRKHSLTELYNATSFLAKNEVRSREMGLNARRHIIKNFDANDVAQKHLQIYKKLKKEFFKLK